MTFFVQSCQKIGISIDHAKSKYAYLGAREDIGHDVLAISEVQLLPTNYRKIVATVTKLEKQELHP